MKIDINLEFEKLIPPLAEDEFKQLEKNILNEGWRKNESIVLWNNTIIDGHNRYHICQKHGIKFNTTQMTFKDKKEVIVWIIDNQLGKRNLLPYDRVRLNLKKEEILKPIAKENQISGKPLANVGKRSINVREILAKSSKVSHGTIDKVKFIESKADEETKKKLSEGEETINKVYINLKKKEQREKVIKDSKEALKLEKKDRKYNIIYADPAWKYFAGGNKNASLHYPCMELKEIKALPISKLANNDCILFIWVTFPMLKESFEVIEAWGFEYVTCGFTWIKRNKSNMGWFFGLGNWTRSNAELCLIAKKGNPVRFSASVSQIIDTPLEEHSKKPDIVRDRIVELCGDLPRIELFARKTIDGWDNWGNEMVSIGNEGYNNKNPLDDKKMTKLNKMTKKL